MAVRYGRVLLWDWERYATGVPVGLDELHFEFGRTAGVERRARRPRRRPTCGDRAAELLAPFGMPAEDARLVWALYATEIATPVRRRPPGGRRLEAGQVGSMAAGGTRRDCRHEFGLA